MCNDKKCSFGRFTGQLMASDPLQTLFQLLSGRIPAVAMVQPEQFTHGNRHNFSYCIKEISGCSLSAINWYWCSVLSAVEMKNGEIGDPTWLLCSPMRQETLPPIRRPSSPWETRLVWTHWLTGCDVVSAQMYKLTVLRCSSPAASKGLIHAAHVCYLTASVPFGVFTQKSERLVLLGSNHRWAVLNAIHSSLISHPFSHTFDGDVELYEATQFSAISIKEK